MGRVEPTEMNVQEISREMDGVTHYSKCVLIPVLCWPSCNTGNLE